MLVTPKHYLIHVQRYGMYFIAILQREVPLEVDLIQIVASLGFVSPSKYLVPEGQFLI